MSDHTPTLPPFLSSLVEVLYSPLPSVLTVHMALEQKSWHGQKRYHHPSPPAVPGRWRGYKEEKRGLVAEWKERQALL